jgi:hypothetical protein
MYLSLSCHCSPRPTFCSLPSATSPLSLTLAQVGRDQLKMDLFAQSSNPSGPPQFMRETRPKPRQVAPSYPVPNVRLVCVEHPCVIARDVDLAISMLGGPSEIKASLKPDNNERTLSLRFQPDDIDSRPIRSYTQSGTTSFLLRVTVPQRTGRRRKRGSDDPFENAPPAKVRKDSNYLLRSMRDSPQHKTQIAVAGKVQLTHVFRQLPDFVYSTADSSFMKEVREKILPLEYPRLKEWSYPRSREEAANDHDMLPPVSFSSQRLPESLLFGPHVPAVIEQEDEEINDGNPDSPTADQDTPALPTEERASSSVLTAAVPAKRKYTRRKPESLLPDRLSSPSTPSHDNPDNSLLAAGDRMRRAAQALSGAISHASTPRSSEKRVRKKSRKAKDFEDTAAAMDLDAGDLLDAPYEPEDIEKS